MVLPLRSGRRWRKSWQWWGTELASTFGLSAGYDENQYLHHADQFMAQLNPEVREPQLDRLDGNDETLQYNNDGPSPNEAVPHAAPQQRERSHTVRATKRLPTPSNPSCLRKLTAQSPSPFDIFSRTSALGSAHVLSLLVETSVAETPRLRSNGILTSFTAHDLESFFYTFLSISVRLWLARKAEGQFLAELVQLPY